MSIYIKLHRYAVTIKSFALNCRYILATQTQKRETLLKAVRFALSADSMFISGYRM